MIDHAPNDLPQDLLTDVVSRALGRAQVDLANWAVDPIGYQSVSQHSRGLFRVHGSALTPVGIRDWALILKAVQPSDEGAASDPRHPFYWKREALAYQSGLLPAAPEGFAAPACFGVTERSDTRLWLWLEAIDEPATEPWAIQHFAHAAAHVGAWGGANAMAALPSEPWLSRGLIRAWVADSASLIDVVQGSAVWNHPLVRDTAFPAFVPAVLALWEQREAWFAALEQLPQTLCHHDLWRKNLLARKIAEDGQQTMAIDWEVVGLGAIGEDIGNLIGVSLLNFDIEAQDTQRFAEALFENYGQGLRRGGWQGDLRLVRAAAQAAAALRCVFSTACWPAAIVHDPGTSARAIEESEQRWGRAIEAIFGQWAAVTAFLLRQLQEARAVLQP